MAKKHPVYDTDAHFSVNPTTRTMRREGTGKGNVIQYDHNSERMTFELPRYIDGHDMSLCNVVEVHYNNIDAKTKAQNQGVYQVDDLQISPDDSNVVVCSWLISRNATEYVGSLNFLIRFSCTEDDGTMLYAWNTAIHSGIQVADGIYNSEVVVEEYADVLEAWRRSLVNMKVDGETLIIQGVGAERGIYYLDPITTGNPKFIKDRDFDLNDLYKPSQCGVYTIDWNTIKNKVYPISNLPYFGEGVSGAVKLIVEADTNTDTAPAVFQTVRLRTTKAEASSRILMWTRQYSSGYWSDWQRFVGADELTTGTLVPFRSLNADKAKNAERAGTADEATSATKASCDVKNRPLETTLNCEYEASIKKGHQFEGYSELQRDESGSYGVIQGGIISFIVIEEETQTSASFIMDVRHDLLQSSCVFSSVSGISKGFMTRLIFSPFSEIIGSSIFHKHYVYFSNADIEKGQDDDPLGEAVDWRKVNYSNPDNTRIYYKYLLKHPNGFPAD